MKYHDNLFTDETETENILGSECAELKNIRVNMCAHQFKNFITNSSENDNYIMIKAHEEVQCENLLHNIRSNNPNFTSDDLLALIMISNMYIYIEHMFKIYVEISSFITNFTGDTSSELTDPTVYRSVLEFINSGENIGNVRQMCDLSNINVSKLNDNEVRFLLTEIIILYPDGNIFFLFIFGDPDDLCGRT